MISSGGAADAGDPGTGGRQEPEPHRERRQVAVIAGANRTVIALRRTRHHGLIQHRRVARRDGLAIVAQLLVTTSAT